MAATAKNPLHGAGAIHLLAAMLVMVLGIWCNSGTLAPYAATLHEPEVLPECSYLVNSDDVHFKATFDMLRGAPSDQWNFSVVLRRILYPVLAFPFMKAFGFWRGGFYCNILMQVLVLAAWAGFLQKNLGDPASRAGTWLTATYPGIMYFAGLPYSYAMIVPLCLLSTMLLYNLHHRLSLSRAALAGLAIGIFQTGYDVLHFYGVALIFIILLDKNTVFFPSKLIQLLVAGAALILPTTIVNFILYKYFHIPVVNGNTGIYLQFFNLASYLHHDWHDWALHLYNAAATTVIVFFTSSFLALPVGSLLTVLVFKTKKVAVNLPIAGYLLSPFFLLAVFMNLPFFAENSASFGFQGTIMARNYQPLFPLFLLILCRAANMLEGGSRRFARAVFGAVLLFQCLVVFGPILRQPQVADLVYFHFNKHSAAPSLAVNLEKYGFRPLGYCLPRSEKQAY
jgi:hypothetical protein